jgi:hypothetical protein
VRNIRYFSYLTIILAIIEIEMVVFFIAKIIRAYPDRICIVGDMLPGTKITGLKAVG